MRLQELEPGRSGMVASGSPRMFAVSAPFPAESVHRSQHAVIPSHEHRSPRWKTLRNARRESAVIRLLSGPGLADRRLTRRLSHREHLCRVLLPGTVKKGNDVSSLRSVARRRRRDRSPDPHNEYSVCTGRGAQSAQYRPNLIVNVENGVDEFRDWADKREDRAQDAAEKAPKGQARRGATESQKARAKTTKDELDDALGELNRSTNRLRRKFDATDTWIETKTEVERVVDDARKINQVLTRGKYGTDAARLWGVLESAINDLAVPYGVAPRLGV